MCGRTLGSLIFLFQFPIAKEGIDITQWNVAADLKKDNTNDWDEEIMREISYPSIMDAILKIKWLNFLCDDKLLWIGNNKDIFSMKECYLAKFRS